MTRKELEDYHKALQKAAEDEWNNCPELRAANDSFDAADQARARNNRPFKFNEFFINPAIVTVMIAVGIFSFLQGLWFIPLIFAALFLITLVRAADREADEKKKSKDWDTADQTAQQAKQRIFAKYEAMYQQKKKEFEAEEADRNAAAYKALLKQKRTRFAASPALPPMASWLKDIFEASIMKADRRSCFAMIQAELDFTVYSTYVDCDIPDYVTDRQNKKPYQYSFTQQRLDRLNDKNDQIGLAQALAKAVQFEIMNQYRSDPVYSGKTERPLVRITSNGSSMHLVYAVRNPGFIPAKKI